MHHIHSSIHQLSSTLLPLTITIIGIGIGTCVIGMDKHMEPLLEADQHQHEQLFIYDTTTTEAEDIAKAVKIGKTFYWRFMMMNEWDCNTQMTNRPEGMGPKKLSAFCEHWKMMAMAANTYLKCLKCLDKWIHVEELETPLKCLCVKPSFFVDQGKLLMSSAMEAIKSVYRDLFKWSDGKSIKIEVKLDNEKSWQLVEFLKSNLSEKTLTNLMKELKAKKDNGAAGVRKFEQLIAEKFPQNDFNVQDIRRIVSSSIFANSKKENFIIDAKEEYLERNNTKICKIGEELNEKLADPNINNEKELQKDAFKMYIEIWEVVEDLGFDMARICESFKECAKYCDASIGSRISFGLQNQLQSIKEYFQHNELDIYYREDEYLHGNRYYTFKKVIEEEWQNANASDEFKRQLPNPCEEAKLKVKKPEMMLGDELQK